jgi:hypothetical protein
LTKLGDLTVGKLIALTAVAFEEAPHDVVDKIARMAAPPNAADSDPTRETILSYIKKPKTTKLKGKAVTRRNRLTPVHYKFAHLVINYLDGRRPDEQSLEVSSKTKGGASWLDARGLCKRVLAEERERRYERPLGSDPGTQADINLITGAYAICRRETKDGIYHQELLILRNNGTRQNPHCHCTYVSENVVTRGEWMIIGHVVYCSMSGHRDDNSNEIGGLYLAHLNDRDMLSGFLAGAGTALKIPVVMPVVAMKVLKVAGGFLELGDLGDEVILRAFRTVKADLSGISAGLEAILEKQVKPVVFNASVCNPELRTAFANGQLLISDRFREFCDHPID